MKYLLLLFITLSSSAFSSVEISALSFNTMCDLCGKSKYDGFEKRKSYIKEIIKKYNADLISLQEIRLGSQVEFFMEGLDQYQAFYTEGAVVSYADPAIIINIKKFKILKNGQFWLGPNEGEFSFGWKWALPRQVHWAKIQDRESKQSFLFIGSHFDNRVENMRGSALIVNKFAKESGLPVIFAADTNCTVDFDGYHKLIDNTFINTFDLVNSVEVKGEVKKDKDLCYTRKGDHFPECRVDHILLSKQHKWKVLEWIIDVSRFGERKSFPSDHRPIFSKFSLE